MSSDSFLRNRLFFSSLRTSLLREFNKFYNNNSLLYTRTIKVRGFEVNEVVTIKKFDLVYVELAKDFLFLGVPLANLKVEYIVRKDKLTPYGVEEIVTFGKDWNTDYAKEIEYYATNQDEFYSKSDYIKAVNAIVDKANDTAYLSNKPKYYIMAGYESEVEKSKVVPVMLYNGQPWLKTPKIASLLCDTFMQGIDNVFGTDVKVIASTIFLETTSGSKAYKSSVSEGIFHYMRATDGIYTKGKSNIYSVVWD